MPPDSDNPKPSIVGASAPFDPATVRGGEAPQGAGGAQPAGPLPSVSLPKSGGAIRDIGEKFAANPVTGTGSMSVPLPLSPGRAGFTPQLALTYDSGGGNGPFGLGWTIALPAITRKTDKGLPRYVDDAESDVFILSGAEDLVPVTNGGGARVSVPRTVHGVAYTVRYYRPRIEGLFARIERWTRTDTGVCHFRSITRDNVTSLYGFDDESRIADPADRRRIFSWLLCRSFDDQGNITVYRYASEDGTNVSGGAPNESNRTDTARGTQRYLKRVQYGNASPWFAEWSPGGAEPALPDKWYFELVLDYGDHGADAPTPTPDRPWPVRPDPFSTYRPTFEVRTYRRCARFLMFHHFPDEAAVGTDCLVRSLDLHYSDEDAPLDTRNPIYTLLDSVTQSGYRRKNGGYLKRSMPPLEFDYSRPEIQPDVFTLDDESSANLPEGIDGSRYQWVDLDGEGLSGVLSDANGVWTYKRNLGPLNQVALEDGTFATRARLAPMEFVQPIPSRSELGRGQQLMDLSGGGRLDLVSFDLPTPGFFERGYTGGWKPFQTFKALPRINWSEPNLKFIDLTGDGLADVFLTEESRFTVYRSLGRDGFDSAEQVATGWDEERGPAIVLSDGTQTIFMADMSGDGLHDLVRIRNGEVCYWPNLGYGRFGAKVVMDGAPRFADQERFDPRRVRLADIDGSGTTDLLYIGEDGVKVCFNQSGNSWAGPQTIAVFPSADSLSTVQAIDLLGNGTACLVWSTPLPGSGRAPLRYVDLMGGKKPHLLIGSRNNLGAETRVRYAPSTRFYLADEQAGNPWVTRLPFPVQVIERVEVFDWIGRSRFVTRYAYHHGYFDGVEREFRGFGMVEQWDTEEHRGDTDFPEAEDTNWNDEAWQPPIHTRTWFHTGVFTGWQALSRHLAHEYWVEPRLRDEPPVDQNAILRNATRAADRDAMSLLDSSVIGQLTADEMREACRALKGLPLRVEVYSDDGSVRASNPYSVVEHNYTIESLQPRGPNLHCVFYAHARETLSFHYERNSDDPRVTHDLTLEVDAFGNVLRSASIGYPRRAGQPDPEPNLPAAFRTMLAYDQSRLHVAAAEHRFTNDLADPVQYPDVHRGPLPSESITAELTGIAPKGNRAGITNLFSFDEIDKTVWPVVWDGNHDIPYEEVPASDVDGSGAPASTPTRRIIEQTRSRYRSDDLSTLLPLGGLSSMALAGESYRLALTPRFRARIFGDRVPDSTLTEGGYVQLLPENNWWAPSGRVYYSPIDNDVADSELAEARAHFYLPRRAVDPFGAISRISYQYDLVPLTTTDAVGNSTIAESDYRVLQPFRITDPNGNRAEVAFDALGMVVGTATMGKVTEALGDSIAGFEPDLDDATVLAHLEDPLAAPAAILGDATTRLLYDLFAYDRTRNDPQPAPAVIYSLARETHVSDLAHGQASLYQHAFSYSDGFGREIQKKVRAEPGPVVDGGPDVSPRWVGSGWTIFNNKGKPVRRYEPFFSAISGFEFAQKIGVSSVLFYDSGDRVIATVHPDNTWEKVVFDAWRQESWDGNDTVLIADPRADADVGDCFKRLFGPAPGAFVSWHDLRIAGNVGTNAAERAAAKDAAQKTEAHAATPTVSHFDSLGRTCLAVVDNGGGARFPARTALDTESKPLAVFDALGRRVFEYSLREPKQGGGFRYLAGYDMAGRALYHNGMDGGERRVLGDIGGRPIRSWDARGHAFRTLYDPLRRPTYHYLSDQGAPEILIERRVYGEGLADRNLCGRLFRQYDGGGLASHERHDFKGNLVESSRQLAVEYHQSIDWSPLTALTNAAALDAASAPLLVAADRYTASTTFDAMNRIIQAVAPYRNGMRPSVLRHGYNEAALLDKVDVWVRQPQAPSALLDPATADQHAVTKVSYNARGQRISIEYGSGVVTTHAYDPLTFRLVHLTTTRPDTFAADQRTVQDLAYAFDPVGNITRIDDSADTQDVIYFRNQRIEPSSDYTYDALYRLRRATGREHLGQTNNVLNPPSQVTDDDSFRAGLLHPGDGNAMGTYAEAYDYDAVGNILQVAHQVASGGWTRHYTHKETSSIAAGETNNRLSSTSLPGDPEGGPYSARYSYDAHGNMVRMPHLPALTWDEHDCLRSTTRQVVNAGTPETTWYSYDAGGERLRKVTDGQAAAGQSPKKRTERLYLGGFEIYREYDADGTTVTLERETLHVPAGPDHVVLVETRTAGQDEGLPQLWRYQHSNHLGSSVLELDDQAQVVSYEEYFPYGSTSYQAVRSQTNTPKRYRYTGKERDGESDLYYHGARYYAPWLGRWAAVDPAGLRGGLNLFRYCMNSPVVLLDPNGKVPVPGIAPPSPAPPPFIGPFAPPPPPPAPAPPTWSPPPPRSLFP